VREGKIDLAADAATKAFDLPKPENLSTTYFLKLGLYDPSGALVSDNFYWLSTKLDTMDWEKRKDTAYTPQRDFADLSGLNSLPPVKLELNFEGHQEGNMGVGTIIVKNPSSSIAFQVHMRVTKGSGGDNVVPIFWEDNYFSLLPGEEKTVIVSAELEDLEGQQPMLELDGYNVVPTSVNLAQ
jgi:exo-1,4-beta-D-glucosaminidase